MITQSTSSSIPGPLEHSSAVPTSIDEANRRTRKRWTWIPVCLGSFTTGALVSLGLVATLVFPAGRRDFRFSSRKKAEADILSIDSALREFAIANRGKFPDGLELLVTPDINGQTFLDMNHVPKDPWGNDYAYFVPAGPAHPHPRVVSYGKDGRPGGEGDDADIDRLSLRAGS